MRNIGVWLTLFGLFTVGCSGGYDSSEKTEERKALTAAGDEEKALQEKFRAQFKEEREAWNRDWQVDCIIKEIERARKPGSLDYDLCRPYIGKPTEEEEMIARILKGENAPNQNTGGSGVVTAALPKGLAKHRRRELADVRADLARLPQNPPADKPAQEARGKRLLSAAVKIQHWYYTAEQLEIPEAELTERMQEARVIATPKAKRLLQECRGVRDENTLEKANELKDLLTLVQPEGVGTTAREVATLVVEERHKLRQTEAKKAP